jgi:methionyl-tRNA formyltransferase
VSIQLLRIVVFSCGPLGAEVAARLLGTPGVESVVLVTAPYARKRPTLKAKIRNIYRSRGPLGLAQVAVGRLVGRRRNTAGGDPPHAQPLDPGIQHFHFANLHDAECLEQVRRVRPDLGVIAGTYVLRESLFSIPRLGCINLHSGKVPEYRGSAPAFWELYNGETEVGITVHWVTAALDAGDVVLQETFPLNPAPDGDPTRYIEEYRERVLRPNGIRLLAQAVADIAAGRVRPRPQDHSRARTYPAPDYRAVRELRRRVSRRRREGRVA